MDLFTGIGHFKCDSIKIEMKSDAEPVRKAPRRVPLALKEKFTKEIQSMVDSGILTKVELYSVFCISSTLHLVGKAML